MSKLKNLSTEIKKSEDEFLTYSFLIEQCISVTPKEGFGVADMKKRLSIHDVITSTDEGKEFNFKAEDAVVVKECVNAMKWAVMHKDIVKFTEDVNKL